MLKIYIGPNGYGKTYAMKSEYEELKLQNKNRKDILFLNSEIVFADEMKDTVTNSFVMEYLIEELLDNDDVSNARDSYEKAIDKSIETNKEMYNIIMDEVLQLNDMQREKDVLATTQTKEYKKIVKINSDDLKNSMGSGQKLQFLLKIIQKSNKKYIFLDEPENHTHPSLLHVTAGLINELSLTKEVCIATHSPELLSLLEIDFKNLYIFNDPEFCGPKTIDFDKAINISKEIKMECINKKSKTYYESNNLQNNINELHKKDFFNAIFSKKIYIVEGVEEELFIKKLLSEYDKKYDQYSIFVAYGKPHFLPFINIFQQLGIEIIPLFDKDKDNDENNISINNEIKKCNKYLESNDILEHELGYSGEKHNTVSFIEFLDEFNRYDDYKYLVVDDN